MRLPWRQLTQAGRVHRSDYAGLYLYTSTVRERRQEQLAARHGLSECEDQEQEMIRAAIVLFYGQLNEQQRRLFAGLESLKSGRGGDRLLAQMLGLNEETVARGRRELVENRIVADRVRRPGAGRPSVEKKRHPS